MYFFDNIKIKVNQKDLDTKEDQAFIYNARTYLPIRYVCEELGAEVEWNESTSTVEITSKIDGKKYTKATLAGMDTVVLEGDDTYISVKSLLENKDRIVSEVVESLPKQQPSQTIIQPNKNQKSYETFLYKLPNGREVEAIEDNGNIYLSFDDLLAEYQWTIKGYYIDSIIETGQMFMKENETNKIVLEVNINDTNQCILLPHRFININILKPLIKD